MMNTVREIIFRGLNSQNEWVYGDLIQLPNGNCKIINNKHGACLCPNGNWIDVDVPYTYSINKETVSQFSGLKDKNGADIYEGDICRVTLKYFDIVDCKSTVVFLEGGFQFQYGVSDIFSKWFKAWDLNSVEIVGNIYKK